MNFREKLNILLKEGYALYFVGKDDEVLNMNSPVSSGSVRSSSHTAELDFTSNYEKILKSINFSFRELDGMKANQVIRWTNQVIKDLKGKHPDSGDFKDPNHWAMTVGNVIHILNVIRDMAKKMPSMATVKLYY